MQGSEAAPLPRISLSFKPACEQKKKFLKEGLSTKETVLYIQLNFIVIKWRFHWGLHAAYARLPIPACYRYIKLISRVIFISKCYLKLTFCVISFIIWQTNARNTPIWLLKDPLPKFHDENKLIILFHFKISIMSNGNLSKISCTCISCRVLLMVHVLTNTTF